MRTLGVVTTSRADWGIYRPLLQAIQNHDDLALHLIVAGMHLSAEHGFTLRQIEEEGYKVGDKVECLHSSDTPEGISASMGLAVAGFARSLAVRRPDILVLLGDRFEMFGAACASAPMKIPLAHLHGGELTQGAVDDQFRHAMTKLSHLHFVSTEEYAKRVIQMGEEPWRVTVCGALSLDNLENIKLMGQADLEFELELSLNPAPLLVTYHPETLSRLEPKEQVGQLFSALEEIGRPVIFTLPNADAGGRELIQLINQFAKKHNWASIRDNLGSRRYFSLMSSAAAMVGNSSSGIIEAPSFGLPVVNLGDRQNGRARAANVIDVANEKRALLQAIQKVLRPGFKESLREMANPYYQGGAADLIVERLSREDLDQRLMIKRFYDLKAGQA